MRYSLVVAVSLALLAAGDAVIAQTAVPASISSQLALRQQDREDCTKQAAQQSITERNQADFVRKCIAERQAARKTAAKNKASDELRIRQQQGEREFATTVKAHEDWNEKRQQLLKQEAAKRTECNKQVREQKLRLAKRWRFVTKCMANKRTPPPS